MGDEPHPEEFLEALWAVMAECWDALTPTGSAFVNLGDKRSGSGAPGTTSGLGAGTPVQGGRFGGSPRDTKAIGGHQGGAYAREAFGRPKSRQGLPERFVLGCEDGYADPCVKDHDHVGRHPAWLESEACRGQGWLYRQRITWEKINGLPESVRDRTRDNFEDWYHLTRSGDYYSAVDEIREPATTSDRPGGRSSYAPGSASNMTADGEHQRKSDVGLPLNELGRIPGSIWRISTEPLVIPDWLAVEHFAAFPSEWPRRLILGWSPPSICLDCGEGRFPVVEKRLEPDHFQASATGRRDLSEPDGNDRGMNGAQNGRERATIVGYACACTPRTVHKDRKVPRQEAGVEGDGYRATGGTRLDPARDWPERKPRVEYHLDGWIVPPSRPAVVLDPFGGTGTVAMVARALGRVGVSLDLSADYCRLARWRVFESGHGAKAVGRTNRERQGSLL